MLIIRIDHKADGAQLQNMAERIKANAAIGVVVLPPSCELLMNVPADWIQIDATAADRVAALERELAQALADLSKVTPCESCKHEPIDPHLCFETGYACKSCEEGGCACRDCDDGSKWEWRHARGTE